MAQTPGPFLDWTSVPGQWTPIGSVPFEFAPSIELEDIDLHFLNDYNVNIPFEFADTGPELSRAAQTPADPCRAAALASDAFHNCHWRFRPNAHDSGNAEEHNLSLPSDHHPPESHLRLDRRVTGARLSVSSRDKILTTVVESCRPENLSRAVASFPSVDLLDSLLQYSLTSPVARLDSFVHAPTFNPNEKRPELLAAMAARGAVLTADPALTKLGHAMQESLRFAIPKHVRRFHLLPPPFLLGRPANSNQWERHNSLVRDLELVQSFVISLEIGLWSGHGRRVEIAESFLQPPLTMLRRGGKFRWSAYPKVIVRDDEQGEELERTWRAWAHQESFKRLVFRVVRHDADSSAALLVNPLVSYAEVQLPLPAPEALWAAKSAEEWKAAFLSGDERRLSVGDFIEEPGRLQTQGALVDTAAAGLAFLSCAWNLAWELVQLASLQRGRPGRWNGLLAAARREELLKLLNHFRIAVDPRSPCAQELEMRVELTLLHLHMPFEEIQLFAGMEGQAQAREVYPSLAEWVKSEEARTAIWHAGQVLRAARGLPRTMLQEHAATTVYHAGLCLWAYGLLFSESVTSDAAPAPGSTVPDVCLDGVEDLLLQRFVQFGAGRPCIRAIPAEGHYDGDVGIVQLRYPDAVMQTVVRVLEASHDGMLKPGLVQQLVQLMEGLQRASRRAMDS